MTFRTARSRAASQADDHRMAEEAVTDDVPPAALPPRHPGPATSRPAGPLTPARINDVTRQACHRLGLDPTDAHLIKFTVNAVVALPAAGAVLRIAGSAPARARIPTVVTAARWFAEHDLPTVRLWPGIDQPLTIGDHQATVWVQTPAGGPAPTPTDLARILRAIHRLDGSPALPRWDPLATMRRRLAQATDLDRASLAYLTDELDTLHAAVAALADIPPLLPPGVLHGDAQLGNLVPTPTGPVICDFDSSCIGPREWDLTPAAVGAVRFEHGARIQAEFSRSYGLDVTTWPGFPTLRRLRELQHLTSVIPVLGINPALRPQWEHRLATLDHPDPDRPWTPFAQIGAQAAEASRHAAPPSAQQHRTRR